MAEYLISNSRVNNTNFCMIGYQIQHTLSDFGSVSRGICEADENFNLKAVVERTEIFRKDDKIV